MSMNQSIVGGGVAQPTSQVEDVMNLLERKIEAQREPIMRLRDRLSTVSTVQPPANPSTKGAPSSFSIPLAAKIEDLCTKLEENTVELEAILGRLDL